MPLAATALGEASQPMKDLRRAAFGRLERESRRCEGAAGDGVARHVRRIPIRRQNQHGVHELLNRL
jgi:hypothetical protein